MKSVNLILGACLLSITAINGYSCKIDSKKTAGETLTAEANLPKIKEQYVKIALLLDTSNSMDGLINQAKAHLWDVVNEFTYAKCGNDQRPLLQIALYEYGNDNLVAKEGYIRQVLGFSGDLDQISEKLFSLTTNGGEEFCGEVIHTSLQQLNWGKNEDDLKLIFIAGNEPFTQGKFDYRDAVTNAKEKDVLVNTIFCGNYEQGVSTDWKNGALLTGGEYMAIDHNQQIVHIATPYDDIIIQLNSQLNDTYVSYGSVGAQKKQLQSIQDTNAAKLQEDVAVKRAVSKSSRLYKNSEWDLVDAIAEESVTIEDIALEDLPAELKGKSDDQIKTYIDIKKTERHRIQKEIQALHVKREAYIAKKQQTEKGELENAMLSAIKRQAAQKKYIWEK
ncbi:MAG: vWA domain-containing protein [Bacteroidota bacterium]